MCSRGLEPRLTSDVTPSVPPQDRFSDAHCVASTVCPASLSPLPRVTTVTLCPWPRKAGRPWHPGPQSAGLGLLLGRWSDAASLAKLEMRTQENIQKAVLGRQVQHCLRHCPGSCCLEIVGCSSGLCLPWPPVASRVLLWEAGILPRTPSGMSISTSQDVRGAGAPGLQSDSTDFNKTKSLPVWGLHSSRKDRQEIPQVLWTPSCVRTRRSLAYFC